MSAFILLYCYLFLVWIFTSTIRYKEKQRSIQSIASCMGLLFLLGLHSPELGCDVNGSYVPAFEHTDATFITSPDDAIYGFELGYMNYMALIHYLTNNVQVFLFITALIAVIPIIYLIYKYSKNMMFSIIIYTSWYLYYFSFSGLRQVIAVGLCAIATNFLFKRKLIPFVAIVYVASLFHTSALLFIIAYPLYVYRISNKKLLIFGLLAVCVLVFSQNSMQLVAMILFGADSRYADKFTNTEFGGFTIAIIYFVFALYQMYVDKKSSNPYLPILILLGVIQTTGIYSQTIPRLAYYFIPLFALSFPEVLNMVRDRKTRMISQCFFIVIFVSFFMMQANGHYLNVTPFKFFWE